MALADRTSIGRYGIAAIAAASLHGARGGQFGAGVGAGSRRPGRGSGSIPGGDHGSSRHDADVDGRHQRQRRRCPAHGPRFSLGQGCLHHDRSSGCRRQKLGRFGINNRGQIVGAYIDAEGTIHGFLLDDGVFTPIDHPDAASGPGAGTAGPRPQRPGSDRGRVRRCRRNASMVSCWTKAWVRRAEGVFTTIDPPDAARPGSGTTAFGINDRGRIVGVYVDVGGKGPWLRAGQGPWRPAGRGRLHHHRFPGRRRRHRGPAINNRGQIVGCYNRLRSDSVEARVSAGRRRVHHHRSSGCHLGIDGARNHPLRPQRPWPDRGPVLDPTSLPRFPAEQRHLHHDRSTRTLCSPRAPPTSMIAARSSASMTA